MDNRVKQYLFDIENSMATIEEFMRPVASFEDYSNHKMLLRAIEREIEIIGEAMNRILKIQPDIEISGGKNRNKIIHGYDEVDDVVICDCDQAFAYTSAGDFNVVTHLTSPPAFAYSPPVVQVE